jgi:hypothetical protein
VPGRQELFHLSHTPNHFCFSYFGDEVAFMPKQGWTLILLCMLPAGMTGACHHTKFIGEDGVLPTFCLGWP